MAVIAVGNIDPNKVEQQIEHLLADQTGDEDETLHHPQPTTPESSTTIGTRIATPFKNQSIVAVGAWNRGAVQGEKAVCDLIQELLRHRAFDHLRLEHCLAYQTNCFIDPRREGGSLILLATVKRGNENNALQLLKTILQQSPDTEVSPAELNALRNKLMANHARMNAVPGWYARELILGAFGDYTIDIEDYLTQLRTADSASINRVLSRLATERARIVVRQNPLLSVAATVVGVAVTFTAIIILLLWLIMG